MTLLDEEWYDLVTEIIENFDLDYEQVSTQMREDEALRELLEDDFDELIRVSFTDSVTLRFEFEEYGFHYIVIDS